MCSLEIDLIEIGDSNDAMQDVRELVRDVGDTGGVLLRVVAVSQVVPLDHHHSLREVANLLRQFDDHGLYSPWPALHPVKLPRYGSRHLLQLVERVGHARHLRHAAPRTMCETGTVTVFLVGAGPGDPDLLTVRARDLLAAADVVLYDRLAAVDAILKLAPATSQLTSVGKQGGGPSTAQSEINDLLIHYGRLHPVVVRLKNGDPFLFGRGGEEAESLVRAGVDVAVVPGVSAAIGVPASVGIPVTMRGVANAVTVVTAQTAPWSAEVDWRAVAAVGGTIVVLMAGAVLDEVAAGLVDAGLPPSTPAAIICAGTRPEELVIRTTVAGLGTVGPLPSSPTVVIGAVAERDVLADVGTTTPVADSVVVAIRRDGKLLFVRRVDDDPWRGLWWLPGGSCEPGEALVDAARREVLEETGIELESIDRVDEVVAVAPARVARRFTLFVAETLSDSVRLNHEHDASTWQPPAFFFEQPLDDFKTRGQLIHEWLESVATPFMHRLDRTR